MELIKKYKSLIVFYSVLNLAFALFISLSSYVHIPMLYFKDYLVQGGHFLSLQFTLFWIIYLLTLNRWLYYGILLPLFFILSIIAFFCFTYDITISVGVIQATLESKTNIIIDLITWQLIVYVLVIITVIILLIVTYKKVKQPKLNKLFIGLALLSLITSILLEIVRPNSFRNRFPYLLYYEMKVYASKNPISYQVIDSKIERNSEKLQVIFVLGESVRADHLQVNGYNRATTPRLIKEENLINFSSTFTTNYYTSTSVTQMLSNASLDDDYAKPKLSLINLLNAAGISTVWIGNQTPERSYYPFISHAKTKIFVDPTHSLQSYSQALDEKLLPEMKANFKQDSAQFLLLHMLGSHWFYEGRYPDEFRQFTPIAASKYLPNNSKEQMINSYDNTILYLDYFLSDVISFLKAEDGNIVLIYISDHGEYLGENGKYLHAQPIVDPFVNSPGLLIWYSDKFENLHEDWINQLNSSSDKLVTWDFVFHTVLDLFGVQHEALNSDKSLLQSFTPFVVNDTLK